MPGIPAFRRQKQEDCCKFKANQSYIVSSRACWTGCIVRPCLDQTRQGWRHITVVPSLGRLKEDWESRVIFSCRESLRPACTTSNSNSRKQASNQPDRKIKRLVAHPWICPVCMTRAFPLQCYSPHYSSAAWRLLLNRDDISFAQDACWPFPWCSFHCSLWIPFTFLLQPPGQRTVPHPSSHTF